MVLREKNYPQTQWFTSGSIYFLLMGLQESVVWLVQAGLCRVVLRQAAGKLDFTPGGGVTQVLFMCLSSSLDHGCLGNARLMVGHWQAIPRHEVLKALKASLLTSWSLCLWNK